jgi:hypothetical protein
VYRSADRQLFRRGVHRHISAILFLDDFRLELEKGLAFFSPQLQSLTITQTLSVIAAVVMQSSLWAAAVDCDRTVCSGLSCSGVSCSGSSYCLSAGR